MCRLSSVWCLVWDVCLRLVYKRCFGDVSHALLFITDVSYVLSLVINNAVIAYLPIIRVPVVSHMLEGLVRH